MGPFIGDFVTEHKGWKWSQYTLAIFYLASWLPIFFLKETYLKVIMARRKRTQSVADTQGPKPAASTLLLGRPLHHSPAAYEGVVYGTHRIVSKLIRRTQLRGYRHIPEAKTN
jgi:hypothetical protein